MGVILDDRWEHEGYGARRLPDGTLTGTWSAATASFDAYVASCGCGWHGGDHPPTEDGYQSAVVEWEALHARPVLARTVPEELRSKIRDVQQEVSALATERPLAGLSTLRSLTTSASATLARAQAALGPTTTGPNLERPGRERPGPSLGR